MNRSKAKALILLRRSGLLKRKTRPNPYARIRVSHTVLPFAGYTPDINRVAQNIVEHYKIKSNVDQV